MSRKDLISSLVLLALGVGVAIESWRMPRFEAIGGTLARAPGLVPGILGLIIALLAGIMLVRTLSGKAPAGEATVAGEAIDLESVVPSNADEVDDAPAGTFEAPSIKRVLVTLAFSVAFAGFLIGRVPFWLAVFLFVFVSIGYNERSALKSVSGAVRTLLIAGVIAGATGFAVPFLFEELFLVTLP